MTGINIMREPCPNEDSLYQLMNRNCSPVKPEPERSPESDSRSWSGALEYFFWPAPALRGVFWSIVRAAALFEPFFGLLQSSAEHSGALSRSSSRALLKLDQIFSFFGF